MFINNLKRPIPIIYPLFILSASVGLGTSGEAGELNGVWQSACIEQNVTVGDGLPAIPGMAARVYGVAWFRFGPRPEAEIPPSQPDPDPDDRLESFAWAFDDSECSKELAEVQVGGSFARPGRGIPEGEALDLTTAKVTMIPLASKVALGMSIARTCGYGDWKVGKPKDVTGCKDLGMPAAGDMHFDLFAIKTHPAKAAAEVRLTEVETLQFGKRDGDHDGTTPETRPDQLGDSLFTRAETKGGG